MKSIYILIIAAIVVVVYGCSSASNPTQPPTPLPVYTPTPDCAKWTEMDEDRSIKSLYGHEMQELNQSLWIFGGVDNTGYNKDLWMTSNGVAWVSRTSEDMFPEREDFSSVVFNDEIVLSGGKVKDGKGYKYLDDVWCSKDGVTWTAKSSLPVKIADHKMVVFKGDIYVIGGVNGTELSDAIYTSTDGTEWENVENDGNTIPAISGHEAVAFRNKIWVIAGENSQGLSGAVYSSENGADWETVTDNAAFEPRRDHRVIVFKERMWLIGGQTKENLKSDIWWSVDGAEWNQVTEKADFTERSRFGIGVKDGRIWISGGKGEKISNEVWWTK